MEIRHIYIAGHIFYHRFTGTLLVIPAAFLPAFEPRCRAVGILSRVVPGIGSGRVLDEVVFLVATDRIAEAYVSTLSLYGIDNPRHTGGPPDHWNLPAGEENSNIMNNRIEIKYCQQCRWLMRAAWMAQELLTTFEGDITGLTLVPGTGGIFEVSANDKLIWSRKDAGRFPEITELKQLVRDEIAPGKPLGHSDKQ